MIRSDADIQLAVLHELKWDTRVDETDVGIEVDSGVVTLTGTVDSWAKRLAAQEAAHRVAGVLDVANDINVKTSSTTQKTDTEIALAVRHALTWNDFLPDTRIRTTVSNGVVTLEGDVDYCTQKEDAERAVGNLSGVVRVVNELQVIPPPAGRYDVQAAIEEALERRAERTAKHVRVDVEDGSVRLLGTVHNWAEWQAVLGAAKGTPGVRNVEDRLRIEPYAD